MRRAALAALTLAGAAGIPAAAQTVAPEIVVAPEDDRGRAAGRAPDHDRLAERRGGFELQPRRPLARHLATTATAGSRSTT